MCSREVGGAEARGVYMKVEVHVLCLCVYVCAYICMLIESAYIALSLSDQCSLSARLMHVSDLKFSCWWFLQHVPLSAISSDEGLHSQTF